MNINFSLKKYGLTAILVLLISIGSFAQVVINGKILDGKNEPIIGATILVKGTDLGAATDFEGAFSIEVPGKPPVVLVVSYLGFENKEITVDKSTSDLLVKLEEEASIMNEVVVSASRVEEKILESPVTIEKLDPTAIKQGSSADYYDEIGKLKGVTTVQGSMTFTSVNTRGFGGISNTRFVQLMDGMDNAAPLLNFPTGNVVGIGELDIHNVELVPGAASALYGPNAFNGIMLMTSKNPFDYQGLSLLGKGGFSYSKAANGADPMYTVGVRYAKAFKEKFAFKVNASYFGATDWRANDYITDRNTGRKNNVNQPNFDGLNTYGDENRIFVPYPFLGGTATLESLVANLGPQLAGLLFSDDTVAASQYVRDNITKLAPIDVRRDGYREEDLLDNQRASSLKGDIALHFRPGKDWEISTAYRVGSGNSVYQGSERYALRNFFQHYVKAEIQGKNLMIRSYMSQTNDGDSYNLTALGAFTNERLKQTSAAWAPEYVGYYAAVNLALAKLTNQNPSFLSDEVRSLAHDVAHLIANEGVAEPGSPEWQAVVEKTRSGLFQTPGDDGLPGAGFIDNSRLFHTEATYDFTSLVKDWMGILVGGNHRQYSLSSQGTVFNQDPEGTGVFERIKINEYGAFIQLTKKFFQERWKLAASVRYDKNENFKGIVSPRVSSVVTLGEKRNHNFRASYQTGFRNPDSQAQFIYFPTTNILLGGTRANAERYGIYEGGAMTLESYDAFVLASKSGVPFEQAKQLLKVTNLDYIKPEKLTAIEVGYKSAIKKFVVDVNGYFNIYEDFITQTSVVSIDSTTHQGKTLYGVNDVFAGRASSPTTWRPYVNTAGKVYSWGSAIGMSYRIKKGYVFSGNYSYLDFKAKDTTVIIEDLGFNTPNHRFVLGLGNRNVGNNFGFDISYKWQSAFDWTSDFASGVVDNYGSLDAMVSYTFVEAKTQLKLGATNLTGTNLNGEEFRTNVGGPFIGRTFFLGVTVDGLFAEPKKAKADL
jgi:iron complex outermembrane receptor protein